MGRGEMKTGVVFSVAPLSQVQWSHPMDPHQWNPKVEVVKATVCLNRLIQGSAADQTKAAMVALAKNGFTPILQVHDEVALSVSNVEEARAAAHIMAEAVRLEVPSRCDVEVGPSWGEAK